jgi:anti-anti-sigma regulatory factor
MYNRNDLKIWASVKKRTIFYSVVNTDSVIISLPKWIDYRAEIKLFFESIAYFIKYKYIIIDLKDFTYATTEVLGFLLVVNDMLKSKGGELYILDSLSKYAQHLLKLLEIDKYISIYDFEKIISEINNSKIDITKNKCLTEQEIKRCFRNSIYTLFKWYPTFINSWHKAVSCEK